jgi:cytochrome c-type biogenesis protein CcmH/NrfF
MISRREHLRSLLVLAAAAAAVAVPAAAPAQAPPGAGAPKMAEGMARGGTVKIQNETERRYFADLLCMCGGCQRESLAECNCGFADDYRDEVRAMMAEGLSQEQIKAEWKKRFGPQALAVPEDKGAGRLLYIVPFLAIAAMAAFVVSVLRRFRRQNAGAEGRDGPAPGEPKPGSGRDAYDDKLDEELEQLDDE